MLLHVARRFPWKIVGANRQQHPTFFRQSMNVRMLNLEDCDKSTQRHCPSVRVFIVFWLCCVASRITL